jgi:protein-disulfide isomerase
MRFYTIALALLLPAFAFADTGNVDGNAFGGPNSPITMEIFSDFQCPACKNLHGNMVPEIMRDFVVPGKVYLIQRYFPLQGHTYGRVSAEFVCAAAHVGKYDQAANALFVSQETWSVNGKVEDAVDGVLTPAEVKKVKLLVKDPTVQSQIQHDLDEGRAVPVMQTPTILITYKGKRYPISGISNYGLLKSFLDDLLRK